jgi:predicted amidohydrolase
MKIGLYQNKPVFGQIEANVKQAVEDLSRIDADLMVLPELFSSGYQFVSRQEVDSLAEEIPFGSTCQVMKDLARQGDMFIVFGMAEKDGGHLYNSAVLMGPDGCVGKYRKTHLFDAEQDLFEPGDTGLKVFDIKMARVGIMICFDWWFPESARTLALLGSDIICHPSNLVLPYCQQAMLTRSLENGVFSVTVNRVGAESRGGKPQLTFTGGSQIVDTSGQMIKKLSRVKPGLEIVEIEPEKARDKKINARNDRFKDRRPEFYEIKES